MAKILLEIDDDIKCYFGCGKTAKYVQSNGRLICEDKAQRCPEVRKRLSSKGTTRNKGAVRSPETRKKISDNVKRIGIFGFKKGHPFYHRKSGKRKESNLERIVRGVLEKLEIPFEQEKYLYGVGTVDFWVAPAYLVIECDGEFWHERPSQKETDKRRDLNLYLGSDIKTLRFSGETIENNISWVEFTIKNFTFPYIGK